MKKIRILALAGVLALSFAGVAHAESKFIPTGNPVADKAKGTVTEKARKIREDADGDGITTKAEYLAYQEYRFGKMDMDADGKLTKQEKAAYYDRIRESKARAAAKTSEGVDGAAAGKEEKSLLKRFFD